MPIYFDTKFKALGDALTKSLYQAFSDVMVKTGKTEMNKIMSSFMRQIDALHTMVDLLEYTNHTVEGQMDD